MVYDLYGGSLFPNEPVRPWRGKERATLAPIISPLFLSSSLNKMDDVLYRLGANTSVVFLSSSAFLLDFVGIR